MTVWLCQCLCEQRHCMIAAAFDDAVLPPAKAEEDTRIGFESMVAADPKNRRCRVCLSEKFHYETRQTPFKTMEEAIPALARTQAANIASGDMIEAIRKSAH